MPVGLAQAKKILSQFKPDVVLSFGGYVSVPVVLAAAANRLPIVIHEQTLQAGLANKVAAKFAAKICISWEESAKFFPNGKTVLTGNPLRKEFLSSVIARKNDEAIPTEIATRLAAARNDEKLLYITGGSGGAHGINVLIEGCLEKLLGKFTVIHQTGDAKEFGDFERLENIKSGLSGSLKNNYRLEKFIKPEEVLSIMNNADLVISRSGINTVTELLFLGKPCLLIPLPYGQRKEQLTNAQFVKKIGLAEIVDQLMTAPDDLFGKVSDMISRLDLYKNHKEAAGKLIHTDAAEKIIHEVHTAYEKEKRIAA
jgi:UDP-N-acetylglucosamine--N-acetylmuramyl-(pentapeptide) pyrophosphoryl-undecaprenol N-acetylglucosamine transferase